MKGNWKSMSGSISIQSCSSNIISKSHNLARKTRGESFSIFCCSCWLRLAYQACLPQHRLEYPHKRNWFLALYKVCNIASCQISNTKTSHKNLFVVEDSNLLCRSFVWMKALLVFVTWNYVFLRNNCFWIFLHKVLVEKSRTTALVFPTLRANWAIGGYPRGTNIVLKKSISNLFSWTQCLPDSYPNFFSENSPNGFVIGLKTEIIPQKDQRRRKREIVRGKTTKIPPSEKLFPSADEPSLFGNICTTMETLEPAEDKIGITQKIHFKTFMQVYIYLFFYLHCK